MSASRHKHLLLTGAWFSGKLEVLERLDSGAFAHGQGKGSAVSRRGSSWGAYSGSLFAFFLLTAVPPESSGKLGAQINEVEVKSAFSTHTHTRNTQRFHTCSQHLSHESRVSAAVSRSKLVVAICLQQWLPGQRARLGARCLCKVWVALQLADADFEICL